jgi:hypothetical protein
MSIKINDDFLCLEIGDPRRRPQPPPPSIGSAGASHPQHARDGGAAQAGATGQISGQTACSSFTRSSYPFSKHVIDENRRLLRVSKPGIKLTRQTSSKEESK